MILIDNRNVLRLKDRKLLNRMSKLDDQEPTGNVIVETAKMGVPTIKVSLEGRTQYLQSKYDPEREAERFAEKFVDEPIQHVLFVGSGMGYHLKKFIEIHPDAKFSIYEPNEEVLHAFLSNFQLDELPLQNLVKIFEGTNQLLIEYEIQQLLMASNNTLKIITLPAYEKIYGEQIQTVLEKALELLKDRHSYLATNISFQKRWTINSVKNFPTVLRTPNILHDVDKSAFKGKPAIIVAAGPSLNEEFENLRYIKEYGLAYIFSVGSAINALIEHGIYPDAACTYDPSERNQLVIKKVKDEKITVIPLVFGSSVGFETLEDYPGKMLHMITSQDTISPELLGMNESIEVVMDAPSIAVITFQLLNKLQCNPIVLVGQNLGFQGNRRYAAGVDYESVKKELTEQEQKATFTVKDVYGNSIQTNEGFNQMRQQLELYIHTSMGREVINTTTGGAHIEGTQFIPLNELISSRLTSKVVQESWGEISNSYNIELTGGKLREVSLSKKDCKGILINIFNQLKRIETKLRLRQSRNMEKSFVGLDREFDRLINNTFYKKFIKPMVRVQYGTQIEQIQRIRFEKDALKKAECIVSSFNIFLQVVSANLEFLDPIYNEMKLRIEEIPSEIENG